MFCNPAGREKGEAIVGQQKYRLRVLEIELHARADDHGAEQGEKKEQPIEPPALAGRGDDPDTAGAAGPSLRWPGKGFLVQTCGNDFSDTT